MPAGTEAILLAILRRVEAMGTQTDTLLSQIGTLRLIAAIIAMCALATIIIRLVKAPTWFASKRR